MAKRRSKPKRPTAHARQSSPDARSRRPAAENRDTSPFSLRAAPVTEERRAILEQIPAWARTVRMRSSLGIIVACVGALVAYNAGGRVLGPALAGAVMIGIALIMWRADKLESRARKRMEGI